MFTERATSRLCTMVFADEGGLFVYVGTAMLSTQPVLQSMAIPIGAGMVPVCQQLPPGMDYVVSTTLAVMPASTISQSSSSFSLK